jgi:hypothetical protein
MATAILCSVVLLPACGNSTSPSAPSDAGTSSDANPRDAASDAAGADASAVIGTSCMPAAEGSPTFDGFDYHEVGVSITSPSGAPTCLVYHFQGLVTCPYGQSGTGQAPTGASPCTTSSGQPVTGAVQPQCTNRRAAQTVVWSCRCANAQGATNDGDAYCTCPTGTTCTQAVSSLGAAEDDYSGAYCIPDAALLGDAGATCRASCDPQASPCP